MSGLRNDEYSDTRFSSWIFPVRLWLTCGIFKGSRHELQAQLNQADGYSRPPLWKRLLRKLKAESKHVHIACCHWCSHDSMSHQYTDLSYQKNFDQGQLHHHSLQASARHASLLRMSQHQNSGVPSSYELDLWKEIQSISADHAGSKVLASMYLPEDDSTPLWQKDRQGPPKKVSFSQ